ncbi:MAG: tyrosine--tRNA ligase [bacterium]
MAKSKIDEKLVDEVLTRSVAEILPSREFMKKEMMAGKKLKIYIGADATGTSLHIGHATNYIILERLRRLGHKVVILIGDFTARIGDPTDKSAARVQLTGAQVKENTKTWLAQLKPILGFDDKENPVEIVYNSDWLSKMTLENVVDLASNFTVQRMMERDMFEKRWKEEKPIFLHEFLYPLMQGYDSVHLNVDVEMCGNDQKFNALVGRTLVQKYLKKEKFVFITTLLVNPVTGEKMMSKSLGTGVFLDMVPNDMYGKLLAQPDENIAQLFTDCTLLSLPEIAEITRGLKDKSVNPKDVKMRLAFEIVKIYHGEKKALEAQESFKKTFEKHEAPTEMEEIKLKKPINILDLMVLTKLVQSKGEARRLIEQGGIQYEGAVVKAVDMMVTPKKEGVVLQKGKRYFVRVIKG